MPPHVSREVIEQRVRADMASTLRKHSVHDTPGLLDELVEDAMFQLEHLMEQLRIVL